VNACRLEVDQLVELNAIAANGNIPDSGVLFGNSIAWIRSLVRVILNLIFEETYIPSIAFRGGQWEARWEPVPGSHLETCLTELATSCPAPVRCLDLTLDQAPETPSTVIVDSIIAYCLDAMIRQSIKSSKKKPKANSIHDAWLNALTSQDARLIWDNDSEIRQFAEQLNLWRRPIDLQSKSAYRLCFRLVEPEDVTDSSLVENNVNSEAWQVNYHLQSKSDQSVQVSVAELWDARSTASQDLIKVGGDPTEFLLTALGQAAGLCPAIAESLKRKYPGGFALNSTEALQFLQEHAEGLRATGFVVMLPSWWVGRGPANRLGLKAKTKSTPSQASNLHIGLDELIAFDIKASLNGQEFSLEELIALAALKAPLVKVRGQWTQIDQDQIQAAINYLQKQQSRILSARELINLGLGAHKEIDGIHVDAVEMDGAIKVLFDKLTGEKKYAQLRQPKGFQGTLRHYQKRGYSWLAFLREFGFGACLADDMGLGKTIQTLALIKRDHDTKNKRPVLLVCPTSVVNNWRKEAAQFTPDLPVLVHHGADRKKKTAFIKDAEEHAIVVSSYNLLYRDIDFLTKVNWSGIILDEAQNIKNPSTKQAKAARSLNSEYRLALTGTPVENHVGDLWSIMEFLNPGMLGSQSSFKNKFHRPIQLYGDENAAAQLKSLTQPFILRRLKTDKTIISDLPDKIETKDFCSLTKEQASLYKAVVDDMKEKIETLSGIERRGLVLATLMKLKQVCNHPAQFAGDNSAIPGRSGKLERLTELLLEIREFGERTLIFSQFREMGTMLQRYLQEMLGEEVLFLHGAVPKKKRDNMVERFQKDEKAPKIFILSLKAGGTGLTLTQSNHVVHYDRWWNPAVENQATDRVFRIGQRKNVQVHKFVVAGTLEERIDQMIEQKSVIASQVVGTGEQWLTELSNKELFDLVRLDKEAIGDQ